MKHFQPVTPAEVLQLEIIFTDEKTDSEIDPRALTPRPQPVFINGYWVMTLYVVLPLAVVEEHSVE
jgi:hypothetical protein